MAAIAYKPHSGTKGRFTSRQIQFCEIVARGESFAAAYKIAYKRPNLLAREAAVRGYKVAEVAGIRDRIAQLRSKSEGKTILSINDRLAILARRAQSPQASDTAVARLIEVYTKIAGDNAPELQKVELTGAGGGPIQTQTVTGLPIRDRLAGLVAAKNAQRDDAAA